MSIISIESISKLDEEIYVTANIEDVVLTRNQTPYDPAEYGPGLCETSFYLGDDVLPQHEPELIDYLENLDLEWNLVDNSDYYFD